MKRFYIIKPGCREFAHELLNYMHLVAYGASVGAEVKNPAFFRYHQYFTFLATESRMTRLFSFVAKVGVGVPFISVIQRVMYALYARRIFRTHRKTTLTAWRAPTPLPPKTSSMTLDSNDAVFFFGWLFRMREGLEPYRTQLLKAFAPAPFVLARIAEITKAQSRKTLIGVYLKQTPYTGFPEGEYLVSPERTREVVAEYLRERKLSNEEVALVLVSDQKIDAEVFGAYTTFHSQGDEPTNLFLLSECSVIIGTNAIYPNLAAWFGNIPHVVVTDEPIDWPHYAHRATYFQNAYATFTR